LLLLLLLLHVPRHCQPHAQRPARLLHRCTDMNAIKLLLMLPQYQQQLCCICCCADTASEHACTLTC
jgi:hypothetical protein